VSTPHYTLIAGAMRMPRLRPLELVSRSVGREWALLPPNVTFRTELKALYAAMMRTVCLSATAIRLMCRWDPQTLRRATEPVFRPSPTPANQKNPIPLDLRHPESSIAPKNRQWNALAGGACALSGVALLAWLLANHPRQSIPPTPMAPADVTLSTHTRQSARQPGQMSRADAIRAEHMRSGHVTEAAQAPDERSRARDDLTTRASVDVTPQSTSSAAAVTASRAAQAVESTPPATSRAAGVSATRTPVVRREAVRVAPASRETRQAKREGLIVAKPAVRRTPHATYRPADVARLSGADVHSPAYIRHDAQTVSIHRAQPRASTAGDYSPAAPSSSSHVDSDYASVTMQAATHLRDAAPAPAPIARGRVDTDNTEWVNHLSQRRITEVPDRFSK